MLDIGIGMDIIPFAPVIAVKGCTEGAGSRVYEIAASIEVVNLKAQSGILIDICREIGPYAVFSVGFRTYRVIGKVGPRALGIRKAELSQSSAEIAEGTQEEELVGVVCPVHVDTIVPGSSCVAQMAVFACIAVCIIEILEVVYCSIVVLCIYNGTETRIQHPLEQSLWYLLLFLMLGTVAAPCSPVSCRVGIVALF